MRAMVLAIWARLSACSARKLRHWLTAALASRCLSAPTAFIMTSHCAVASTHERKPLESSRFAKCASARSAGSGAPKTLSVQLFQAARRGPFFMPLRPRSMVASASKRSSVHMTQPLKPLRSPPLRMPLIARAATSSSSRYSSHARRPLLSPRLMRCAMYRSAAHMRSCRSSAAATASDQALKASEALRWKSAPAARRMSAICATAPAQLLYAFRLARPSGDMLLSTASSPASRAACASATARQPRKPRLSGALAMPASALRRSRRSSMNSLHVARPAAIFWLAQRMSAVCIGLGAKAISCQPLTAFLSEALRIMKPACRILAPCSARWIQLLSPMRIARPSGDMELRAPRIRLPRAAASSVLSRHWLSPARTLEPRIVSTMAFMRVIVSRRARET